MKNDIYVEEFCNLTNRAEEEIAPHIKQCLIELENGELEELYEATNNPEKIIEAIQNSTQFYRHLKTFNQYEELIQDFSKSITKEGIKESLFNILSGIQHSYERETGASVYQWDVSDFDQCAEGVAKVCADFGTNIEILVNNAGITRDHMMHKMTKEDWDAVIAVDLTACFNMSHAVIRLMREKEFGRIINISSINAQLGQIGQTNYSAAKAGVIGFTKSLARENASKSITVNAVAPGYTDTAMVQTMPDKALKAMIAQIPVGRLAQPEEIARAVVFLAADESSFITGETLSINGGHYMQ